MTGQPSSHAPEVLAEPAAVSTPAGAPTGTAWTAARAPEIDVAVLGRDEGATTLVAARPLRVPLPHALLIAPHGCSGVGEHFNVLIHFHGAFTTVEPRLMQSGIDAVYLIQNLGNGSGAYEDAYAQRGTLDAELEAVRHTLSVRCGGPSRSVDRVALSGWSAGYGAIYRILARPEEASRVDAVLLADGMHVGYEPGSHRVRAAAMAPYLSFADAAARGERLMVVTHSAIVPPGYASTTATSEYLVKTLALAPEPAAQAEPRPGMRSTGSNARGNLTISGYAGGDAHAHCDHLYAIGDTLWSPLRARWASK